MEKEKPKSAEEQPYVPRGPNDQWYSAQFFTAELIDDEEPAGVSIRKIVGAAVLIAVIAWGITR
jgi:hypothetical protein